MNTLKNEILKKLNDNYNDVVEGKIKPIIDHPAYSNEYILLSDNEITVRLSYSGYGRGTGVVNFYKNFKVCYEENGYPYFEQKPLPPYAGLHITEQDKIKEVIKELWG